MVQEGETLKLMYAIKWAQDHDLQIMEFEIDLKIVADAVV